MAAAAPDGDPERPPDDRTIAIRGAVAVVLSVAVNLAILMGVLAGDLVEPFEPLSVGSVGSLTAVGAAGATVVYWAIARRSETPDRTFAIVAAVALVLSLLPDVALLAVDPAATVPGALVLMAMHVATAAICVAGLTGHLRRLAP